MITRSNPRSGMSTLIWVAVSSPMLPVRNGRVAGVEQRLHGGGLEQLQGADFSSAVGLAAVGHGVESGLAEADVGLRTGEGGTGDVDGRRHHVAAVEDILHHGRVQLGRITAGAFMAGSNLFVHRGQQGAGSASKIGDAELADGVGVAPVHAFHLAHGKSGQQGSGRGQGVEGGQVLAVGDEALEYPARSGRERC